MRVKGQYQAVPLRTLFHVLIARWRIDPEYGRRRTEGEGGDGDVHMTSPLGEVAVNGASFAGSIDGRSISPYDSSRRQTITGFGGRSFSGEPVKVVGRSPISPSTPAVDYNGRDKIKISYSTYGSTLTSSTDSELAYNHSRASGSDQRNTPLKLPLHSQRSSLAFSVAHVLCLWRLVNNLSRD